MVNFSRHTISTYVSAGKNGYEIRHKSIGNDQLIKYANDNELPLMMMLMIMVESLNAPLIPILYQSMYIELIVVII